MGRAGEIVPGLLQAVAAATATRPGRSTTTTTIENSNDQWPVWSDSSIQQYRYWAGPAGIYAPGRCVREEVVEYDPSVNAFMDCTTPWHSCS